MVASETSTNLISLAFYRSSRVPGFIPAIKNVDDCFNILIAPLYLFVAASPSTIAPLPNDNKKGQCHISLSIISL